MRALSKAGDWVEPVQAIVDAALPRLIDFQGRRYARRYLRLLDEIWRLEQVPQDPTLTVTYGRQLARLMAYEPGSTWVSRLLRPWSYRYREEWRHIADYRAHVLRCLSTQYELAVAAAGAAEMVSGDGRERRGAWVRALRHLQTLA